MIKDFTIKKYEYLLEDLKKKFVPIFYGDYHDGLNALILRHDIDISPNRALRMAKIEEHIEIKATYFFQISSEFYNIFEKSHQRILKEIRGAGHKIGLHFDPNVYDKTSSKFLVSRLKTEMEILSNLCEDHIGVFSLHNPTTFSSDLFLKKDLAGYQNASSNYYKTSFRYCSDSNGMWRYRSVYDVLSNLVGEKLHLLIHPEWWQERYMSPLSKVKRSINGRGRACIHNYLELLKKNNRPIS